MPRIIAPIDTMSSDLSSITIPQNDARTSVSTSATSEANKADDNFIKEERDLAEIIISEDNSELCFEVNQPVESEG